MKRIIALLAACALIVSGCSSNDTNTPPDRPTTTASTTPPTTVTEPAETTTKKTTQQTSSTAPTTVTKAETTVTTTVELPKEYVVYNDNDIVVTIKDIFSVSNLTYQIDNMSDTEISTSLRGVAINGVCIGYMAPLYSVAPERSAIEKLDISDCITYGIYDVETIDLFFTFSGDDERYFAPVLHLDCAVDESGEAFSPSGDLVYSDDMIDVYSTYSAETSFEDMGITYYNKSDMVLSLSIMDVSANDIMLSGYATQIFNTVVLPGCYASMGGDYPNSFFWDYTLDEIYEKTESAPVDIMRGKVWVYSMTDDGVSYEYTSDEVTIYES